MRKSELALKLDPARVPLCEAFARMARSFRSLLCARRRLRRSMYVADCKLHDCKPGAFLEARWRP